MVYCIIDTVVSKTWTTIFMKCNSTDILHFAKKQKNLFTERYSEILSNKLLTWCKWSSIFHFLKTTLIQCVKYLICHFNVVSFYSCHHQHSIIFHICPWLLLLVQKYIEQETKHFFVLFFICTLLLAFYYNTSGDKTLVCLITGAKVTFLVTARTNQVKL